MLEKFQILSHVTCRIAIYIHVIHFIVYGLKLDNILCNSDLNLTSKPSHLFGKIVYITINYILF